MSFLHIRAGNPQVNKSLLAVWMFLNNHYSLYKQSYGAFVNDASSFDGNYVIRKDGEIVFFMNYVSCGLRHLVVNLMAGNSPRTIMMAIGLSMYTIFNNGHEGLVFHVNVNNKKMLGLVQHAGMEETSALRTGLRSFKCSTTHLIKIFGLLYHRFLMMLPSYNIEFFQRINNEFYITNGWNCIKSRHIIFGQERDSFVYLKEYDVSFHCSNDLLRHLYDSKEDDGISISLKRYLKAHTNSPQSTIEKNNNYKPVSAIFLPTSGCNLNCRYCYSEASPIKDSILDLETAKTGIDFIFNNAIDRGIQNVDFSFLGGGEPMMVADLNCKLVDYIRQKESVLDVQADVSVCTNGTIYTDYVRRLLKMSNHLQLSFDGLWNVQNLHRPFAGGKPSYDIVVSNIQKIKASFPKLAINVRATVSNYSVERMPAFVELLSDLNINSVSFEPLIVTGRALSNTSLKMPDMNLFIRHFIEAKMTGSKCGVDVKCSASAVFRRFSFCGATYNNFVITPEGLITTCVEVSSTQDPLADLFIIGNISNGRVNINKEKVSRVREYDEIERIECQNCISKKSCRGNCPARTIRFQNSGEEFINELCIMQTRILLDKLKELHSTSEQQSIHFNK